MFEVSKKLVVISGGSQGLGASLAKIFVENGASVIIVARTETKLQNKVKELEKLRTHKDQLIDYVSADISTGPESARVFAEVGSVPDIVLCCAGGATPGLFVDMTTDQLNNHMNLVYNTALHFSHAAVKVMSRASKNPTGPKTKRHLVFCSSVLAVFPFIGYSSYGPGKAAIRALADILRQECLPFNIDVYNILPGNIDTEGFEQEERTKPEITRQIEGPSSPLNPDDVAKQVFRDLKRGQKMIYTDFIGWFLSGSMLGASPRNWGFVQFWFAVLFGLIAPIWAWLMRRDIRAYFSKAEKEERSAGNEPDQIAETETEN